MENSIEYVTLNIVH
ncbi:Protein of unknown function [Bacillus wiedmannii]|uniref:Uncharacterized protein n=1 Tax=Bacillus wiedmannii TaxID=1890302 RepID=A0AB37YNU0_9BACI|nr:Protein of unknown function [Bacillus wiedmannii]